MPDDIIVCPSCNRKLRMAELHQGQIVQCPLCSVIFRTPIRTPPPRNVTAAPVPVEQPMAGTPPAVPKPAEPQSGSLEPERRTSEPASMAPEGGFPAIDVQRALLLPGMSLLVAGVLSVIAAMRSLGAMMTLGPNGMLALMKEMFSEDTVKLITAQMTVEQFYTWAMIGHVIALLIALGIVLGAVQMLRLERYRLAMVGSILACLNIAGLGMPCCFFTAPLGLWSVMVLRLPEVRSAFDAPPEPESETEPTESE